MIATITLRYTYNKLIELHAWSIYQLANWLGQVKFTAYCLAFQILYNILRVLELTWQTSQNRDLWVNATIAILCYNIDPMDFLIALQFIVLNFWFNICLVYVALYDNKFQLWHKPHAILISMSQAVVVHVWCILPVPMSKTIYSEPF